MKTPQNFSYRSCAVVTGVNSSSAFSKQICPLHHSRKKYLLYFVESIAIVITESLCTVWAVDVHCVADLIWLRGTTKDFLSFSSHYANTNWSAVGCGQGLSMQESTGWWLMLMDLCICSLACCRMLLAEASLRNSLLRIHSLFVQLCPLLDVPHISL